MRTGANRVVVEDALDHRKPHRLHRLDRRISTRQHSAAICLSFKEPHIGPHHLAPDCPW